MAVILAWPHHIFIFIELSSFLSTTSLSLFIFSLWFAVSLAFVVVVGGGSGWLSREERVHAFLCCTPFRFDQSCNLSLSALQIESLFFHQIMQQTLLVNFSPLQFDCFWIEHFVVDEQLEGEKARDRTTRRRKENTKHRHVRPHEKKEKNIAKQGQQTTNEKKYFFDIRTSLART